MASFKILRSLALCWPMIHGRALSLGECQGVTLAKSGRPDGIDAKTHEMRQALTALDLLARLALTDVRAAAVVTYTHVMCGAAARAQREHLSEVGRLIIRVAPYRKISQALASRIEAAGYVEYIRARDAWARLR